MRALLLLFIIMPIVEMWLLIEVGGAIGALPTIGLVFLTAAIGFAMLRKQGFDTLRRGNWKLEQGELPALEMAEGLILAVSGALLLTPGFVTDAIGFAGLTPPFRRWIFAKLGRHVTVAGYRHSNPHRQSTGNRTTIEGDFRRED